MTEELHRLKDQVRVLRAQRDELLGVLILIAEGADELRDDAKKGRLEPDEALVAMVTAGSMARIIISRAEGKE